MVRHNHIGRKALGLHVQGCPEAGLGANGFGFKVRHPWVHFGGAAALRDVVHQAHPLPRLGVGFLHGHGHHFVALLHQRRRQELKLPWKVLMDKQNFHERELVMAQL